MKKVTIVSGHPDLSSSVGNKMILAELEKHFGENIKVRRLDSLYPDYKFDLKAEQDALVWSDVIVFQFPVYWYSAPAILKKWQDDVLAHDFAYGSKGDKLHGKKFVLSFTTGGDANEYGHEAHTIDELMPPFMDMVKLCGMEWQSPVYTHEIMYVSGVSSEEDLKKVQANAYDHAKRLIEKLESL